jgi:hypothetical protein
MILLFKKTCQIQLRGESLRKKLAQKNFTEPLQS